MVQATPCGLRKRSCLPPLRTKFLTDSLPEGPARTLAAADNPADTAAAAGRLLEYYLHTAATANLASALDLYRGLGHRLGEAVTLGDIGILQRLTGDYPAAATSLRQSLELNRDLGSRLGQAKALNSLGELSSRTSESHRARDQQTEALAIARNLGVPLEEARALEGIGHSHLQIGNPRKAAAHLRQALTIYQRIGAPRARQVQKTLRQHRLHHRDNLPTPTKPVRRREIRGPDGGRPFACLQKASNSAIGRAGHTSLRCL